MLPSDGIAGTLEDRRQNYEAMDIFLTIRYKVRFVADCRVVDPLFPGKAAQQPDPFAN